jgi:hypothetical protein
MANEAGRGCWSCRLGIGAPCYMARALSSVCIQGRHSPLHVRSYPSSGAQGGFNIHALYLVVSHINYGHSHRHRYVAVSQQVQQPFYDLLTLPFIFTWAEQLTLSSFPMNLESLTTYQSSRAVSCDIMVFYHSYCKVPSPFSSHASLQSSLVAQPCLHSSPIPFAEPPSHLSRSAASLH